MTTAARKSDRRARARASARRSRAQKLGEELVAAQRCGPLALELPERADRGDPRSAQHPLARRRSRASASTSASSCATIDPSPIEPRSPRETERTPRSRALRAGGDRLQCRDETAGRHHHGLVVRLGDDAGGCRRCSTPWPITIRGARGLGASHARSAVRIRRRRAARGLEVIIAGAGGAAHLPGMTAAKTSLPVLGVPVQSKTLSTVSIRCCRSCRCRPACRWRPLRSASRAQPTPRSAPPSILANKHAPHSRGARCLSANGQTAGVLDNPDPRTPSRK